ncbi:MAG: 5-(carboxyamino)imidazole ribonucleotide mutase [Clostridia bacterium]
MAKVAILMGSKSDLPIVKECNSILMRFGIEVEMRIMSAHRTPALVADFAQNAKKNGYKVIIAAAGKAAHLAGVVAANTALPVIGIPIKSSTMDGLDSLLSTVQMPSGIPVATVAIDGAINAGLLAVQILAVSDPLLYSRLVEYRNQTTQKLTQEDLDFLSAQNLTTTTEEK